MGWAIDQCTEGILPRVAVLNVVAFEIVSTGQAQERGLHGGKLLHQVDAVSVGPVFVGGRKERDKIDPYNAWMGDAQAEMILTGSGNAAGLERKFVTVPVRGERSARGARDNFAAVVVGERDCDRAG